MLCISIVPTGLVLNLTHNPGTKVPGYFRGVPTGRKMAPLQRPEGPAVNRPGLTAGIGIAGRWSAEAAALSTCDAGL